MRRAFSEFLPSQYFATKPDKKQNIINTLTVVRESSHPGLNEGEKHRNEVSLAPPCPTIWGLGWVEEEHEPHKNRFGEVDVDVHTDMA